MLTREITDEMAAEQCDRVVEKLESIQYKLEGLIDSITIAHVSVSLDKTILDAMDIINAYVKAVNEEKAKLTAK